MPATERYQVDVFAIVTLIVAVLIVVFLIIAAIYFSGLMNLKPPSSGEATFLFWTSIVLAVIFVGLAVWAVIQIITHKSIVYEEPFKVMPTTPTTVITSPPVTTPGPASVYSANTTTTSYVEPPSTVSTSYSDIPVTSVQRQALTGELLTLSSSMDQ